MGIAGIEGNMSGREQGRWKWMWLGAGRGEIGNDGRMWRGNMSGEREWKLNQDVRGEQERKWETQ